MRGKMKFTAIIAVPFAAILTSAMAVIIAVKKAAEIVMPKTIVRNAANVNQTHPNGAMNVRCVYPAHQQTASTALIAKCAALKRHCARNAAVAMQIAEENAPRVKTICVLNVTMKMVLLAIYAGCVFWRMNP